MSIDRAGIILNAAHVLAAGADERADLLGVDVHRRDARRVFLQLGARLGERALDHIQDHHARFMRLRQRLLHDLFGETLDLDVHLQRRDALRTCPRP